MCDLANAQSPFGFGIEGGLSLTDGFDQTFGSFALASTILSQSAAKDLIVGPSVDFRLPLGLGFEADALYRPVSFEYRSSITVTTGPTIGPGPWVSSRQTTFEFPVLAKYRLPFAHMKPIVEGGASFRTGGGAYGLGHYGFTLGGGLEFKLPIVRLSSDLRYTRWASGHSGYDIPNQNQVELLFGVSF